MPDGPNFSFWLSFPSLYPGHFLLTHLLMDKLRAAEQARIINNTALAYKLGNIDFDDINCEKKEYKAGDAYSQSKLALVFFTQKLAKELQGKQCKMIITCVEETKIRGYKFHYLKLQ